MKPKLISLGIIAVVLVASVLLIFYFVDKTPTSELQQNEENSALSESQFSSVTVSSNKEPGEKENSSSPDVKINENAIIVKMNEPITLRSMYYKQGETKNETVPFLGWDGDMEVTVKEAQLLSYDENTNVDWTERFSGLSEAVKYEEPTILALKMEIKNIDASNSFGVKSEFHPNFSIQSRDFYKVRNANEVECFDAVGDYYIREAYFSKHADGDDYYTYTLNPGESIEFDYVYYIDKKALDFAPLFLNPTNSQQGIYGIELNLIKEG